MYTNKTTRQVHAGGLAIGGGAPISIQSMLNAPAHDIAANVSQALALETAGCDIVRVTVPDMEAVKTVYAIKEAVKIPLVADIHFDWRMALESVAAGVDKVRINPGNIGDDGRVREVALACKAKGVPIRIGVNGGSLEKDILKKYGSPTSAAMVESGMYHISLLEKHDFNDIVLSLKSSNVQTMYDAYSLASEKCPYPLHLGVTEAGTENMGVIKSAAGIGGLLLRGIGDTIRVSLTDDPIKEVIVAKEILKALDMKKDLPTFISCPTCGRTNIGLIPLAQKVEEYLNTVNKPITVAVMGCAVNGPGEARDADIGIAGGNGEGLIFKKGEIVKKVPEEMLFEELKKEIELM